MVRVGLKIILVAFLIQLGFRGITSAVILFHHGDENLDFDYHFDFDS